MNKLLIFLTIWAISLTILVSFQMIALVNLTDRITEMNTLMNIPSDQSNLVHELDGRIGDLEDTQEREKSEVQEKTTMIIASCDEEVTTDASGKTHFPVADAYKGWGYLGELFTADDCGRVDEIQEVKDGLWQLGARITFDRAPDEMLRNALLDAEFFCASSIGDEDICKEWHLTDPVPVETLIPLQRYVDDIEVKHIDCVYCG